MERRPDIMDRRAQRQLRAKLADDDGETFVQQQIVYLRVALLALGGIGFGTGGGDELCVPVRLEALIVHGRVVRPAASEDRDRLELGEVLTADTDAAIFSVV